MALTVSLDTSVLVALILNDLFTDRAKAFLAADGSSLIVSNLAIAEFASVVARRVRTADITRAEALEAFANFDAWSTRTTLRVEATSADMTSAAAFIRRLDLNLRTPDALHIAIADRLGTALATFDTRMATNAAVLGVAVAPL